MAAQTGIEWTDATVNFWWGCTKVGPGCDHCYAETWARRTGGDLWGVGVPRRKIQSAVKLLHRLDNDFSWWAADHHIGQMHATAARRVFIQSMSDLFDKEVPDEWFDEAWQTITRCNRLAIQIVTKRISVVEKRLAGRPWPQHAGLLISVTSQEEADRDVPRLLALKAKLGIPWVGLSMEPLLGPVDLTALNIGNDAEVDALRPLTWQSQVEEWRDSSDTWEDDFADWFGSRPDQASGLIHPALDWVIVGGESGKHARPIHPEWVRSLRDQCEAAGVPFFFKQWGEWATAKGMSVQHPIGHVFDDGYQMIRMGKKASGRMLDGVLHDGLPEAFA